jgi:hypothetical protein
MEVHATHDSSLEETPPAASILPPRELPSESEGPDEVSRETAELAFQDHAPRVDSDPPQVLDLDELAFQDEAPRVDSDPPQALDLDDLALHEVSQRVDSDPPQALDVAALEFAADPGRSEGAGDEADLRPEPAARVVTPGVGPLPPEKSPLQLRVTPREAPPAPPEPAVNEPVGAPLRPRKLLAPREARQLEAIDAELIPDEVHDEFAARRAAQDLSVAERQARAKDASKRSALVIGGVFALGALLMSVGSGLGAFVVFLCDVGAGAGTGWYLGTKRPNRLIGALTAWGAALALAFTHVAIALALYGPSSLLALFFPLILFQGFAALTGMLLSTHLESLEFDQSI